MTSSKKTRHKQIGSSGGIAFCRQPLNTSRPLCSMETLIHIQIGHQGSRNPATLLQLEVSCKSSMYISKTKICWSSVASHHTVIRLFLPWFSGKRLPPSLQLRSCSRQILGAMDVSWKPNKDQLPWKIALRSFPPSPRIPTMNKHPSHQTSTTSLHLWKISTLFVSKHSGRAFLWLQRLEQLLNILVPGGCV